MIRKDMVRTSTPTHIFTVKHDEGSLTDILKGLLITYKQGNNIVLEKRMEDVTIEGDTIRVKLTQEETKKFKAGQVVLVQVRSLLITGDSIPSPIFHIDVGDVLNDEVML